MTNKVQVLVVDDDPPMRKLVRGYLEKMGMQVEEASCGAAAISHLSKNRPDLVCLDLTLPEFSGFDICDFIRSRPELEKVPVLMISARKLPGDRALAEEAGVSSYLTKPFKPADFANRVNELLSARKAG
jgi:DNA-binding response OmpR family regulator